MQLNQFVQYHQALAFSPDSCWLVSVARSPELSLVVWDVPAGEAVAVGRAAGPIQAVAWVSASVQPEFVSVGEQVLIWTLEPSHLCQREISLPLETSCRLHCVCSDNLGRVFVGDDNGCIWTVSSTATCNSSLFLPSFLIIMVIDWFRIEDN